MDSKVVYVWRFAHRLKSEFFPALAEFLSYLSFLPFQWITFVLTSSLDVVISVWHVQQLQWRQSSDLTSLNSCCYGHIGYHDFILCLLEDKKRKFDKAAVKVKGVYMTPKNICRWAEPHPATVKRWFSYQLYYRREIITNLTAQTVSWSSGLNWRTCHCSVERNNCIGGTDQAWSSSWLWVFRSSGAWHLQGQCGAGIIQLVWNNPSSILHQYESPHGLNHPVGKQLVLQGKPEMFYICQRRK